MTGTAIAAACLAGLLFAAGAAAQSPGQARELEARGDWKGAESEWRALVTASPGDYRLWTDLGVSLAHEQHYREAIAAYRKALALNPRATATEVDLGLAYFKQGDFGQATAALRGPAALPGNTQAEGLFALSLYGAHRYREAIPHLEKLAAAEPGNSELLQALAQSYLYSREYAKAKAEFETMLARDADSPGVHMLLAQADDALNRTAGATAELRAALAHGYVPNAHFGIGYILWRDRRYDEAAAEFRLELESDPRHAQALAYLGDIQMRNQDAEAGTSLGRAAALDGTVRIAQLDLGILAANAKRYRDAIAHFQRAIALGPEDADAHYRLARIYQATGRPNDAQAELATVTRLHRARHESLIEKISGPAALAAK